MSVGEIIIIGITILTGSGLILGAISVAIYYVWFKHLMKKLG